jgi:hypothetical protein
VPIVSKATKEGSFFFKQVIIGAFIVALVVGCYTHYHKIVQNEYVGYPEVMKKKNNTKEFFFFNLKWSYKGMVS